MKRVLFILLICCVIGSLFVTGCGRPKIRVGTGMAPERLLLAQMIIVVLEENGYDVVDMTPTGSTEVTHKALESGMIDIYPEYTGNYLETDTKDPDGPIVWMKPAPADNKWAISIPRKLAVAERLATMSDFAAYVNDPERDNIRLMCSYEFTVNPLALPLFEDRYRFKMEQEQLKIIPDTNTLYMGIEAAADNDINAAMAYTTDGHLEKLDLIILEDDKNVQPVFHPAPIVRRETYDKYADELNRILTPLFASLDDKTLRHLNSQIGLVGKEVTSEIARKYVQQHCMFKYSELYTVQSAMDEMMKANNLSSIPARTDATSDMSSFPDERHALYSESRMWPFITWRTTRGTYTCDNSGRVTQVTTGW